MGINEQAISQIREFALLRDEYLRFRDSNSINRITQFEIEQLGLEAAIAKRRKGG